MNKIVSLRCMPHPNTWSFPLLINFSYLENVYKTWYTFKTTILHCWVSDEASFQTEDLWPLREHQVCRVLVNEWRIYGALDDAEFHDASNLSGVPLECFYHKVKFTLLTRPERPMQVVNLSISQQKQH